MCPCSTPAPPVTLWQIPKASPGQHPSSSVPDCSPLAPGPFPLPEHLLISDSLPLAFSLCFWPLRFGGSSNTPLEEASSLLVSWFLVGTVPSASGKRVPPLTSVSAPSAGPAFPAPQTTASQAGQQSSDTCVQVNTHTHLHPFFLTGENQGLTHAHGMFT